MSVNHAQFIVYACPVGELNRQIEAYFVRSLKLYGQNSAHQYMPHCSLTGFFTAESTSITTYIETLNNAYIAAQNEEVFFDVSIKQLTFNDNWHGLELSCDRLKQLIANFSQDRNLANFSTKLRLKDWLHLSLAYDFNSEYDKQLQQLTIEMIDLKADVSWELRFYQKNLDWSWECLQSWKII